MTEVKDNIEEPQLPLTFAKRVAVFFVSMVLTLTMLLGITIAALNLPIVQTFLVHRVAASLSRLLKHPIYINYLNLNWYDSVIIKNILIKDRQRNRMIRVKELTLKFSWKRLITSSLVFEEAILKGANVQLIVDPKTKELNINEFIEAINEAVGSSESSSGSGVFGIRDIRVVDSEFSYNDKTEDSLRGQFDWFHFKLDSLNGDFSKFRVAADTIEFNVAGLKTNDIATGLKLKRLNGFYRVTRKNMELTNMYLEVGNSILRDKLRFEYDSYADFSDFNRLITMKSNVKAAEIDIKDLSYFAPQLTGFADKFMVSGQFTGTVDNFLMRKFNIAFGNSGSRLAGDVRMRGLPEYKTSFISLHLDNSKWYHQDLRQYVDTSSYGVIKKVETAEVTGSFNGTYNNFIALADVNTAHGKAHANLTLDLTGGLDSAAYDGILRLENAELGYLAGDPRLGRVTMEGEVIGTGMTRKSAHLSLKGDISDLTFKGYTYHNISTNSKLAHREFSGYITIADSNLNGKVSGTFLVNGPDSKFDLELDVAKANPERMRWLSGLNNVSFASKLNFTGLNIDDINGDANIKNLKFIYKNKTAKIDSLDFVSGLIAGTRYLNLESDLGSFEIEGDFDFDQIVNSSLRAVSKMALFIEHDEAKTADWYAKNNQTFETYDFKAKAVIRDLNKFTSVVYPDLRISTGSEFTLNADADSLTRLNFTFLSDSMKVAGNSLQDLKGNLAGYYGNKRETFNIGSSISVGGQKFSGAPETQNLSLDFNWRDKDISFNTGIEELNATNTIWLKGIATQHTRGLDIVLDSARLVLLDSAWVLSKDNHIYVDKSLNVDFSHTEFNFRDQSIGLEGKISDQESDSLFLSVKNVQLSTFRQFVGWNLTGLMNSKVNLVNLLKKPMYSGSVSAKSLSLDKTIIGDVDGTALWDNRNRILNIDFEIEKKRQNIMRLTGRIIPEADEKLFLKAFFNKTNLGILETFLGEYVTAWAGEASGIIKINGDFVNPIVRGKLFVENGTFKYKYINTLYRFTDTVDITEKSFGFDRASLIDENGNKAFIKKGLLRHDRFNDFYIDLQANMNRFQLLKTSAKDNSLYYGTANGTGNLSIIGKFDDLKINATVKSERGTNMTIPISDESNDSDNFGGNITFKDSRKVNKSIKLDSVQKKVNFKGIKMNFNLDITPDADINIIMNTKTGEAIRGAGTGKIALNIDTYGDFTMIGGFDFERGVYNWYPELLGTFLGQIGEKKFQIQKGSTIAWNGSPLQGTLNLFPSFKTRASLEPLMPLSDSAIARTPEGRRLYPVAVNLNLTGELLKPQVSYGISINDYPNDFARYVTPFENKIKNDEQELARQSIMVLMANSFMPTDPQKQGLNINAGAYVNNFLSNQLNSFVSQFDENLELGVDINQGTVNFSYSALNKKLRISRTGVAGNSQQTASSVAGDWTLEYVLSKDGKVRMKAFHKNTQNLISQSLNTGSNTSTGVSLLHTTSFNSLRELFGFKKKK